MSRLTIEIFALFFLLILSAFFSCSETAFFSLTRSQISDLKRSDTSLARQVIFALKKPRDLLITLSLGNELVNVAFAIVIAATVYDFLGDAALKTTTLISILIATPLVLIFGEVIPKNIAVRYARFLTLLFIVPIRIFYKIVFPIRVVLTKFADVIVKLFGGDPSKAKSMIMEEEFRQLVDLGYEEGVIEEGETELIHRLFELGNRKITEIMTPAGEIFKITLANPFEKIIRGIRATQFNRIPVYQGDFDNYVGVIHTRDIFRVFRSRQRGQVQELEELLRPLHTVKEDASIEDVLTDFQKLKMHMATVVNTKGEVVGLVTMDDIFRLLFIQKLDLK